VPRPGVHGEGRGYMLEGKTGIASMKGTGTKEAGMDVTDGPGDILERGQPGMIHLFSLAASVAFAYGM